MFILKHKNSKKYVRAWNSKQNNKGSLTTNINEARTYLNLEDIGDYYLPSVYNSETHTWDKMLREEFSVIEVEIKEKKSFDYVRKH